MLQILISLGLIGLPSPRPNAPTPIHKLHASEEWADCIDEHVGSLDEDEAGDMCAEDLE